jgi:hypothetical protein
VSKVLGLGVRGIGWREIEIERLPTGQPAVRLHGRAARRADQLEMGQIAVSISHEKEFAVATAYGVRTAGGRYLLPPDIEDRLDERERRLLAKLGRLRAIRARARRRDEMPNKTPPEAVVLTDAIAGQRCCRRAPCVGTRARWRCSSSPVGGLAGRPCWSARRPAGRAQTLATLESLQPLLRQGGRGDLPLPEDDVEEVDPEEAPARILITTPLVVGPGHRVCA